MKKKILIALSGLTFVFGLSSIIYFYGPWWFTKVHDYDDRYGTVGSIELPKGYERVNDGTGFDEYLRDLPLASEDVQVRRITGELADTLNPYCYRMELLPTDFEVRNLRLEYRIPAKLGDTLIPVVYHIGETIVVSLDIHGEASAIVEFS